MAASMLAQVGIPLAASFLPPLLDKLGSWIFKRDGSGRVVVEDATTPISNGNPAEMVLPNNANVNQAPLSAAEINDMLPVFDGAHSALNNVAVLQGEVKGAFTTSLMQSQRAVNKNKGLTSDQTPTGGNQLQFTLRIPAVEIVDMVKLKALFQMSITFSAAAYGGATSVQKIYFPAGFPESVFWTQMSYKLSNGQSFYDLTTYLAEYMKTFHLAATQFQNSQLAEVYWEKCSDDEYYSDSQLMGFRKGVEGLPINANGGAAVTYNIWVMKDFFIPMIYNVADLRQMQEFIFTLTMANQPTGLPYPVALNSLFNDTVNTNDIATVTAISLTQLTLYYDYWPRTREQTLSIDRPLNTGSQQTAIPRPTIYAMNPVGANLAAAYQRNKNLVVVQNTLIPETIIGYWNVKYYEGNQNTRGKLEFDIPVLINAISMMDQWIGYNTVQQQYPVEDTSITVTEADRRFFDYLRYQKGLALKTASSLKFHRLSNRKETNLMNALNVNFGKFADMVGAMRAYQTTAQTADAHDYEYMKRLWAERFGVYSGFTNLGTGQYPQNMSGKVLLDVSYPRIPTVNGTSAQAAFPSVQSEQLPVMITAGPFVNPTWTLQEFYLFMEIAFLTISKDGESSVDLVRRFGPDIVAGQ